MEIPTRNNLDFWLGQGKKTLDGKCDIKQSRFLVMLGRGNTGWESEYKTILISGLRTDHRWVGWCRINRGRATGSVASAMVCVIFVGEMGGSLWGGGFGDVDPGNLRGKIWGYGMIWILG